MLESAESKSLWREAQKEAESFGLPEDWQARREWVSGIAIDGKDSKDRDDAIWFSPNETGGYDLTVSIADVGTFVPPDSAMARHAEFLGETRYVKAQPRPMLPRHLGERALSLLEEQVTPTLTLDLKLDATYNLTDTVLSQRLIRAERATYEEVASYTHGEGDEAQVEKYRAYEQLALAMLRARQRRGAFAFYEPEQGLMTGEDGQIIRFEKGVEHSGQVIVQEFMIATNAAIGLYMQRHRIRGVFRKMRNRQNLDVEAAVAWVQSGQLHHLDAIRKGMGRAEFSTEPGEHEALMLPVYAQGSSPLRRYSDLVNQWYILAHREGREYPFSEGKLEEIVAHLNKVRREVRGSHPDFREVDERRSQYYLQQSVSFLAELPPGRFHRVVTASVRLGDLPLEFREALDEKLQANSLPLQDIVPLLCNDHTDEAWVALKSSLMDYLVDEPGRATAVLEIAHSKQVIDALSVTPIPATSGFTWAAKAMKEDQIFTGAGSDKQSDRARHLAALHVLGALTGTSIELKQPEQTDQQPSRNPKSILGEYMQKNGLPLPHYVPGDQWKDGSETLFTSTVTLDDQPYTGYGRTKKGAEVDVAAKIIAALGITDTTGPTAEKSLQPIEAGNPISSLNEYCQGQGFRKPDYTYRAKGPAHRQTWEASVTISNAKGASLHTFTGEGQPSKSAARAAAAAIANTNLWSKTEG